MVCHIQENLISVLLHNCVFILCLEKIKELERRRAELAKSLEEEGQAEKAEKRKLTPAVSKTTKRVHISPIVID